MQYFCLSKVTSFDLKKCNKSKSPETKHDPSPCLGKGHSNHKNDEILSTKTQIRENQQV